MTESQRPLFSIGAVARMLELPPATLRTWELRYGLVVPDRSPGGQRLYSREQVDQLRFVRDEVAGGSRPAQAHRLLAERLGRALRRRRGASVHVFARGELAGSLLRELLERDGFAISDGVADLAVVGVEDEAGAETCGRLKRDGDRVLALVAPDAADPPADAVLRLPVGVDELLRAARSLASR
ncbi:MAG TPA: MerR family transcriptional regulator [Gaiellaceae bacterium]|nr:MerR family transcriptional regulator [Gaiellaceae bacterium]